MSVTTMFWILTLFQNNYAPQHFMYVFCIFVGFIKILNNNNFFEIKKKLSFLSFTAIFIQQCHFLRQAGHSEKAVSLFQALIDFTFFKPDSVKDLATKGQVAISI